MNKFLKFLKPKVATRVSLNQETKVMKATANMTPGIAYPDIEKIDK